MKTKILLSLLVALLVIGTVELRAQEDDQNKETFRTLFSNSNGRTEHGGYAALTIGYTDIDHKPALEVGGRAAWLINHQFALGFVGKGFFNDIEKSTGNPASEYYLAGGYGGLFFQPIIYPKAPVHVSFPIILGVGGIAVNSRDNYQYHWDYDYSYNYAYDSDIFLVFEPGIDVEFNLLRYLRMSLGASYRFTNNVNLVYEYKNEADAIQKTTVDPGVLNNFSFNMAIMFGWF